jgi:hypothetical protein
LQRELSANQTACVVNFGVWDYVSTQELLLLARQLQRGGRPDWVLFFDGVNDILSAYHSGRADVHPHLDQIAGLFDNPRGYSPPLEDLLMDELEESTYIVPLFQQNDAEAEKSTYQTMGIAADDLGEEVARRYLGNLRIIEALAAGYGFEFRAFWQPIIALGDKPLTEDEQHIFSSLDPAFLELLHVVYDEISASENVIDLSGIFDDDAAPRYVDGVHLFPEANTIIAAEMLRHIESD